MMRTLYLHIGHGKTGSSYIQSSLALSINSLLNKNILYPHKNLEEAKKGYITSGNGDLLFSDEVKTLLKDKEKDLLFSSEMLFHKLTDHIESFEEVNEFCKQQGIEKVKILLFIRNPISHASSDFQQSIKRGGNGNDIISFFDGYRAPTYVRNFIEEYKKIKNSELKILNYSKHKKNLLECLSEWLNIERKILVEPENKTVNRSLTFSELEFQRNLNKKIGYTGDFIADPLCNLLPNVPSEVVLPSTSIQEKTINRLFHDICYVNNVALDEGYDIDITPQYKGDNKNLIFSLEQIEVLSRSIGDKILNIKNSEKKEKIENKNEINPNESLSYFENEYERIIRSVSPVDFYRELALMFEKLGSISVALSIMQIAKKMRPNGPVINQKIEEYQNTLDKQSQ